jgi:PIN domain nuclease of toxin-antitoxin system
MEAVVHLDTHVVVWLYAGDLKRFPSQVKEVLENHALAVSPAVVLELQYLYEIKRVSESASVVIADLDRQIGLTVSDSSFQQVASLAMELNWTRDPFDRLIVAQATAQGAALVSKDRTIRKHYGAAVWSSGAPQRSASTRSRRA